MEDENLLRNLTIGPGVIETMIAHAASGVEGVAAVGNGGVGGILANIGRRRSAPPVLVIEEDGQIKVRICIQVLYGHRLPEVADNVRIMITDTLASQAAISISEVDVIIDGIQFNG
jgi:uncharacterized alkaline shock family protein YloU